MDSLKSFNRKEYTIKRKLHLTPPVDFHGGKSDVLLLEGIRTPTFFLQSILGEPSPKKMGVRKGTNCWGTQWGSRRKQRSPQTKKQTESQIAPAWAEKRGELHSSRSRRHLESRRVMATLTPAWVWLSKIGQPHNGLPWQAETWNKT